MGSMTEDGKFEGTKGHARASGLIIQGKEREEILKQNRKHFEQRTVELLLKATIEGMSELAKGHAIIYRTVMLAEAVHIAYLEGFIKQMPPEAYEDVKTMLEEARQQGEIVGRELATSFGKFVDDEK